MTVTHVMLIIWEQSTQEPFEPFKYSSKIHIS